MSSDWSIYMMTECSHHLDQSNDNTHSLRCMYITQTIKILHVVNLTIILSKKRTTKVLIRL